MKLLALRVVLVILYCTIVSEATICKPNSFFKIDCNKCMCTDDGTKYSCSNLICPGRQHPKYAFDDPDYVLTKQGNVPYLNDEMPDEDPDGTYQNDIPNSVIDDNEEGKLYEEDKSDEEANSINNDYKYKGTINF